MVAAALTDIAGSSDVVDCGFVTYSNDSKIAMLGVSAETLAAFGAVSEQVAQEMATGALAHSRADLAVSTTGIAGPGGSERIMAEALCGLIGPVAMSTAGRLRFSQLARLIKEARLFLGADSSVLQLAAAVGTPVVGVFGPSDYARARPWGTVNRVVRVDTAMFEGELRADYLARMDRALARITAQQVSHAAEEVIRITTP